MAKKKLAPAMIPAERYARWVRENPKKVKGTRVIPLTLASTPIGEDVTFEARQFTSKVDGLQGKDLQLFGYTRGPRGFKVYATVLQREYREYLLRGDYCHTDHPVEADDGKTYPAGTPHFHYLDPQNPRKDGSPSDKRKVTPQLAAGLDYPNFLEHFCETYYFRDAQGKALSALLSSGPSSGGSSKPTPRKVSLDRFLDLKTKPKGEK